MSASDKVSYFANALHESRHTSGWVSPSLGAHMLHHGSSPVPLVDTAPGRRPPRRPGFPKLTASERSVLGLIAVGYTDRKIASKTGRNERTIKYHVSNMLAKFQAQNRAHLVNLAIQTGQLPDNCPNGQDEKCTNDTGHASAS